MSGCARQELRPQHRVVREPDLLRRRCHHRTDHLRRVADALHEEMVQLPRRGARAGADRPGRNLVSAGVRRYVLPPELDTDEVEGGGAEMGEARVGVEGPRHVEVAPDDRASARTPVGEVLHAIQHLWPRGIVVDGAHGQLPAREVLDRGHHRFTAHASSTINRGDRRMSRDPQL